jgi:sugar phosphate permease
MIVGALIAGLCLVLTSRTQTLGQFYLLRGIGFTVGSIGFGNLVVNVTVSKWFVRNRGMAIAIASCGVSLGGVIVAPVCQALVDAYGWRPTWVILGVATWVVIIPLAFAMRRTPEDYGLHPDGDTPGASRDTDAARSRRRPMQEPERSWTRPEAVRTASIWMLIVAYGIANIGLGALLFHMIPFLTDQGFSSGRAAFMFSFQSWAALISKPVWGALMNRMHARYLSAISFVIAAASVLGLLVAADHQVLAATMLMQFVFGFAIGGTIPLQETVWASYFGRMHLGQIRAIAMPFTIVFSAVGPKLAAHLYDSTGSYVAAFLVFASFWMAGALLVLVARPPKRRPGGAPTRRIATPLPAASAPVEP